jgi:RNA polymerase sigma-70 factor (ECF subfamily)
VGVASRSDGLSKFVDLHLLDSTPSGGEASADALATTEERQSAPSGSDSLAGEATVRVPRSDADALLVRVQNRDERALSELFDKYSRLVFSIGHRVLRSSSEAEDLVQDVFLFLWSRSKLFVPGNRSGHDWIVRVIYHRAFDRRRYLITRLAYNSRNGNAGPRDGDQGSDADRASRLVSNERNFGELLYWHSFLETAFEELSEDQRKTLSLFFYEGYTLAEIGKQLGQPLMNIRNHYYRGLRRLEKCIDDDQSKD